MINACANSKIFLMMLLFKIDNYVRVLSSTIRLSGALTPISIIITLSAIHKGKYMCCTYIHIHTHCMFILIWKPRFDIYA